MNTTFHATFPITLTLSNDRLDGAMVTVEGRQVQSVALSLEPGAARKIIRVLQFGLQRLGEPLELGVSLDDDA